MKTELPRTRALVLEEENEWLTIWFNTPENRNALAEELFTELMATLNAIRDDRTIRGITLRGKGGVFCAGGDLKGFRSDFHDGNGDAAKGQDIAQSAVAETSMRNAHLFALINSMPQAVLILVEGAAIAGGLGIVCCADIVAVTEDARFALTETQIGIPPAQIAPYVVGRIGMSEARRLMVTGARFSGAEAKALGLANYVTQDAEGLDLIAREVRKSVLRCAPGANAATKAILNATQILELEALQKFAADRFASCMLSEEGREGIASFIEKRKPDWNRETLYPS